VGWDDPVYFAWHQFRHAAPEKVPRRPIRTRSRISHGASDFTVLACYRCTA
jgi:hypothetical protein